MQETGIWAGLGSLQYPSLTLPQLLTLEKLEGEGLGGRDGVFLLPEAQSTRSFSRAVSRKEVVKCQAMG